MAESLRAVAIASGRSIIAPSILVSGKDAPALDGDHTAEEALNALLAGSGLRYRVIATGLIIERDSASRETAQQSDQSEVVV
ncbi:STN domain-containing protein, partial [Acinetobacter baumannii]